MGGERWIGKGGGRVGREREKENSGKDRKRRTRIGRTELGEIKIRGGGER